MLIIVIIIIVVTSCKARNIPFYRLGSLRLEVFNLFNVGSLRLEDFNLFNVVGAKFTLIKNLCVILIKTLLAYSNI